MPGSRLPEKVVVPVMFISPPTVRSEVNLPAPSTSKAKAGEVVPMPTLPEESINKVEVA